MNPSIVERLKSFFFEAALATYAGGMKPIRPADRPWIKQLRYDGEGKYLGLVYLDEYSTRGESSGGETVILDVDDLAHPLWIMQYHGWCKNDDPGVLRFLKGALSAAYERRIFHGGRGIPHMEAMSASWLVYDNHVAVQAHSHPQDFTDFQGHERIWRRPDWNKDIFWHRYQGYLLEK